MPKEFYTEESEKVQSLINMTDDQDAEIKRLRAALETIAKYHSDEIDSACAFIARKALIGGLK